MNIYDVIGITSVAIPLAILLLLIFWGNVRRLFAFLMLGWLIIWHWLKSKKKTFIITFLIVTLIMVSPIIIGYLLYFMFKWLWALSMATGYLFFWNVIPFTPFWAIDIAISTLITKIILNIRRRNGRKIRNINF